MFPPNQKDLVSPSNLVTNFHKLTVPIYLNLLLFAQPFNLFIRPLIESLIKNISLSILSK